MCVDSTTLPPPYLNVSVFVIVPKYFFKWKGVSKNKSILGTKLLIVVRQTAIELC